MNADMDIDIHVDGWGTFSVVFGGPKDYTQAYKDPRKRGFWNCWSPRGCIGPWSQTVGFSCLCGRGPYSWGLIPSDII